MAVAPAMAPVAVAEVAATPNDGLLRLALATGARGPSDATAERLLHLVQAIANGGTVFGTSQELVIHFLGTAAEEPMLQGLAMDVADSTLPLVRGVSASSDSSQALKNCDVVVLTEELPPVDSDLFPAALKTFKLWSCYLDVASKKTAQVVAVDAALASLLAHLSPSIPKEQFTFVSRISLNRAVSVLAKKLGVLPNKLANVTVWGIEDVDAMGALLKPLAQGKTPSTACEAINDLAWVQGALPTVRRTMHHARTMAAFQNRNFPNIGHQSQLHARARFCFRVTSQAVKARGKAVATGAKCSMVAQCKAIADHLRDLWQGTAEGEWTSLGTWTDGSYGLDEGVLYSQPVTIKDKVATIVPGLTVDPLTLRGRLDDAFELLQCRQEQIKVAASD
eukprot:m.212626 g.212626  ORF g.212626 m.212626 type:complete len:393 (-) comp18591_c0_seq8:74-1252(-)